MTWNFLIKACCTCLSQMTWDCRRISQRTFKMIMMFFSSCLIKARDLMARAENSESFAFQKKIAQLLQDLERLSCHFCTRTFHIFSTGLAKNIGRNLAPQPSQGPSTIRMNRNWSESTSLTSPLIEIKKNTSDTT
jgi:hypothetical protein